jgi:PhzF family phenazine biosynthesis protein
VKFRLLNVFAESRFGGNPLAVVEDAGALGAGEMQSIARQFNLSETAFLLPSDRAAARVRIFTPSYEMAFAGHPTLGAAEVVRMLGQASDRFDLELNAGLVSVAHEAGIWWLRSIAATSRTITAAPEQLAAMLELPICALSEPRLWLNTGNEQPMIPLTSVEHVRACRPVPERVAQHCRNAKGQPKLFVFARTEFGFVARYFAMTNSGVLYEDPGTGSAAANLGAWWRIVHGDAPLHAEIHQGDVIDRPCRLYLRVHDRSTTVGGRVRMVGRGELLL